MEILWKVFFYSGCFLIFCWVMEFIWVAWKIVLLLIEESRIRRQLEKMENK